jgi:putative RNA 2'-phosphotransferase
MTREDLTSASVSDVDLSRAVSHALRHAPWVYELELDEEGWTPLAQLVTALAERGGAWAGVDEAAVRRMVQRSQKQRHEIAGELVRARYGHSLPGRIRLDAADPPARLFHGTSPRAWSIVARDGLRPMARQYVHLSTDVETASSVGRRKSRTPVLLAVDARAAAEAGTLFYRGNDRVWLTDGVPARCLTLVP